jgi:N-acetylglucosamine malate deacetylase 1
MNAALKRFGRLWLRRLCIGGLRLRARPLVLSSTGPTLVLAPHADDEALGCGALLAQRCASGVVVHVAFFTDSAGAKTHLTPSALAALRADESRHALATLGLDTARIHFLGAPDGRLKHLTADERAHWITTLTTFISRLQPREILLPSRADGSSEHEAMFALVAVALAAFPQPPRLLEFPVWACWNPRFLGRLLFRSPCVWCHRVAPHAAAKATLLRAYPSQTEPGPENQAPVLSPEFLAAFRGRYEFYFETRSPA